MIPKVIHYCWFGGKPLPPMALKCIESWKKFFPDYEIKRWDESNFDVNMIPYTQQAYEAKKYAFVSDYARFWILYHFGGIYFDTDVEVIRPFNKIIEMGPFMGCENHSVLNQSPSSLGVNPGLGIGAPAKFSIYKSFLEKYSELSFKKVDGTLNTKTIVEYTSDLLTERGLINIPSIQQVAGCMIYPVDYFCPMDYETGKINITEDTVSIHHYAKSWHGGKEILFETVSKIFGKRTAHYFALVYKKIRSKKE